MDKIIQQIAKFQHLNKYVGSVEIQLGEIIKKVTFIRPFETFFITKNIKDDVVNN